MSSMFAILIKSGLVYVWDNNISGLGLRQDTYASSVQERHQLWQQNKLVIILKVFCWWRGLMIRFLRNNLCTKQHSVRSRCSMGQLLSNRNHNHPSFHNNHITYWLLECGFRIDLMVIWLIRLVLWHRQSIYVPWASGTCIARGGCGI